MYSIWFLTIYNIQDIFIINSDLIKGSDNDDI